MIYVVFSDSRGSGFFGFFIKVWQRNTAFSHVTIRFYDTRIREHVIIESSHGEVHMMEWTNWKKHNQTKIEIPIKVDEERIVKLLKSTVRYLQLPYSFKNIAGIVLKRFFGASFFDDDAKAFICSELIGELLKDKLQIEQDLDFITPADIYNALKRHNLYEI